MQSCSPNSSIESCANILIDISNKTASTNPIFEFVDNQQSTVSGDTYDAHFLIGNYYNDKSIDIVCPTNWLVPTTDSINNGSYIYLLNSYGLTSSIISGSYDARKYPLYYIYTGDGNANNTGTKANYRATSNKSGRICGGDIGCTSSPLLTINNTQLSHSSSGATAYGYSIRCVFRGQ